MYKGLEGKGFFQGLCVITLVSTNYTSSPTNMAEPASRSTHAMYTNHMYLTWLGDWAKSTMQAKLHHDLLNEPLCLLLSAVMYGPLCPHQLIYGCLPGSDQPILEWACLVSNTWWHQRLELAHSPFARVCQALIHFLSIVCFHLLSSPSLIHYFLHRQTNNGMPKLCHTHTPKSYY